jgi:pyruvate kinase
MPIDTTPPLLKYRRTRIVATLGPSSSDAATLARLVEAGVDVFRLNMSHGTQAGHAETLARVRAATAGLPTTVFADLCGPKIRVERFADGAIELVEGEAVTVTTRDVVGGPGLVPTSYAGLPGDVCPGARMLLDDGNLALRVEAVDGPDVRCVVEVGGTLKDRKGINLPGVNVSAPSLTEKDRADARFALEAGVDALALSFVRRAADVHELRALMDAVGVRVPIIAKIEKPEALEDIEAILDVTDAIMVARGDLGVELPPEAVPLAQEALIEAARAKARPVIVATQMLESMVDNPRPTRAEVSDVANAVRSGADGVMLSAETAAGRHPVAAVRMMDRVARQTEAFLWAQCEFGSITERDAALGPVDAAIARCTARLSRDLDVRALVVVSHQGRSAAVISASRPAAPIVVATPTLAMQRRVNLGWGVLAAPLEAGDEVDLQAFARAAVQARGLAEPGDPILVVGGFRPEPADSAPTVTVLHV